MGVYLAGDELFTNMVNSFMNLLVDDGWTNGQLASHLID